MIYEDIFKPQTFDEYVGQDKAKNIIQIMLDAAEQEERFYPNILLTGSAGQGKTSLAKLIFDGIPHDFVDGKSVTSDLFKSRFVIIDEIHNVKPSICDSLNLLIDDSKIVIVGATTNPGDLPGPFRSRFQIIHLVPYTLDELVQIISNVVQRKGTLEIAEEYLYQIASRSRETPRTALKYLSFVMDYMIVNKTDTLTQGLLDDSFTILGVDEDGLLEIDHKYLEAFPVNNTPVGVDYLSAVLSQDKETIEQDIEPYLMNRKLIDRTPRGRVRITKKSYDEVADLIFKEAT